MNGAATLFFREFEAQGGGRWAVQDARRHRDNLNSCGLRWESTKKPGIPAGLQLEMKAVTGLASNLQIDCLRPLAATIRFRVEAHFLVF